MIKIIQMNKVVLCTCLPQLLLQGHEDLFPPPHRHEQAKYSTRGTTKLNMHAGHKPVHELNTESHLYLLFSVIDSLVGLGQLHGKK